VWMELRLQIVVAIEGLVTGDVIRSFRGGGGIVQAVGWSPMLAGLASHQACALGVGTKDRQTEHRDKTTNETDKYSPVTPICQRADRNGSKTGPSVI
jgi:hypothetical protein